MYTTDHAHFLSLTGLALQTALKKNKVKLDLLTDVDMVLLTEKSISGGKCHAIHAYVNSNSKYMNKDL